MREPLERGRDSGEERISSGSSRQEDDAAIVMTSIGVISDERRGDMVATGVLGEAGGVEKRCERLEEEAEALRE